MIWIQIWFVLSHFNDRKEFMIRCLSGCFVVKETYLSGMRTGLMIISFMNQISVKITGKSMGQV